MSEFKSNSDERTIELLQERINGFKHQFRRVAGGWSLRPEQSAPFFADTEYRKAKQTRVINGITVPMCMTERPRFHSKYYVSEIDYVGADSLLWVGDQTDEHYFFNGLAFLTLEDAQETRKAILAGTKI
jgi:hypothetical protein